MSIASRIESISENLENAYNSLDDLGIDLTGINKNLSNLSPQIDTIYENWPKVTSENDITHHLTPTKKGNIKLNLNADTKQYTTTGKNFLNLISGSITSNGLTSTIQNGIISISGTLSSTWANITPTPIFFETPLPAGQYTFSSQKGVDTNTTILRLIGENTDQVTLVTSGTKRTITITEEKTKFVIFIDSATSGTKYNLKMKYMLESGSDATTWEPYTGNIASPNSDYIQNIQTITGENTIQIEGKNLFDTTEFENQLVEGKIINDNGVEVGDATSTYSKYKVPVKANTTYYRNGAWQRIYVYDKDNNLLTRGSAASGFNSSYNISKDGYLLFQISNEYWANHKGEEQIEYGDTKTTYTPNIKTNYPLSLGNLEFCKIGSIKDEFIYNTTDNNLELNKWYIKKHIGKLILNGNENNWSNWGSGTNTQGFKLSSVNNLKNITGSSQDNIIISNYFTKAETQNNLTINDVEGFASTGGNLYFRLKASKGNITSWLSTHNTVVYYIFANPEYILLNETLQTQLNNISKAKSYNEQTNISQISDNLFYIIDATALKEVN